MLLLWPMQSLVKSHIKIVHKKLNLIPANLVMDRCVYKLLLDLHVLCSTCTLVIVLSLSLKIIPTWLSVRTGFWKYVYKWGHEASVSFCDALSHSSTIGVVFWCIECCGKLCSFTFMYLWNVLSQEPITMQWFVSWVWVLLSVPCWRASLGPSQTWPLPTWTPLCWDVLMKLAVSWSGSLLALVARYCIHKGNVWVDVQVYKYVHRLLSCLFFESLVNLHFFF